MKEKIYFKKFEFTNKNYLVYLPTKPMINHNVSPSTMTGVHNRKFEKKK